MKKSEIGINDVVKYLKKVWKPKERKDFSLIPERERKGYMTYDNIAMIIPKTTEFKELIENLFGVEGEKIPDINYVAKEKEEIKATFSTEYLQVFLEMAKKNDYLTIQLRKDYPIKIISKDFDFLIAPRIEYIN